MLSLRTRAIARDTAQDVANTLLALYERGWKVEKKLAVQLLEELVESLKNRDKVLPYEVIQALRGVEHHGVMATDLDLSPLVTYLLEKCPPKY